MSFLDDLIRGAQSDRKPQAAPTNDQMKQALQARALASAPKILNKQGQMQWLAKNAPETLRYEAPHTELPALAQFFQELPKAAGTVGAGIGHAIARTPETVYRSAILEPLVGNATKTPEKAISTASAPNTGLRELLYGKEPVQSYQEQSRNIGQAAKQSDQELIRAVAPAAPFLAPAMAALDLSGIGKGGLPVTKAIYENAAKPLVENTAKAAEKTIAAAAVKHEQTMLQNAAQHSPVIINRLEHINPAQKPIDQAIVSQHIKDIQNKTATPVIGVRDDTGYLNILGDHNKIEAYKQLGFDTIPTREITPGQLKMMKQGGYAKVPGTKGTIADPQNDISRFPARLMEDPTTAPINNTLLRNSSHEVAHNADTLANSAANISRNEEQALSLAKHGESADANATAMQLLEKYLKEGSYDKASDLTDSVMPRFTRQGQSIQILSRWGRLDPAGAVKYAARQVDKHNAKNLVGTTLEDTLASTHNTIKSHAKEVATQLESELNTGKLTSSSSKTTTSRPNAAMGKVFSTAPKTPEQRLADRINASSTKKLNEPDPVKDMVNTLHKVAKQVLPESSHKSIPRNPMQLIGQAISDKANYRDVYDKAKALVMEKYANNPVALQELEKYFGTEAQRTYAAGQLNQGVKLGLKGTDLGKLVKQHYSQVDETGKQLEQKLIEQAGLTKQQAHQLAGDIKKRYGELVQQRKDSIIKQMFGDKPKSEQLAAFERILTMKNLGALGKDELRPLVAKKLGLDSLSGEDAKKISQMAEHIQTLKEGSQERHMAIAQMMDYIGKLSPNGLGTNLVSLWKAGLLSGAKTTEGNIVSNGTFALLKKISDPVTVTADKAMSVLTGKRTATMTQRGAVSGTIEGFKKGATTLKTGVDFRMAADKYEAHAGINFKNKTVQKVLGKGQKVFDFMSAQDQPFYYSHLKNSLYDIAKADGITKKLKGQVLLDHMNATVANPSETMMERAVAEANKSVLSYDTLASKAVQGMHRGIDSMPVSDREKQVANAVIDVLAPFVRVPTAFLSRSIDYTPLGIGKTLLTQVARKQFDQRDLAKAIGEGMTGTGVIGLGILLSQTKQLSGDYPTSPKEQARWKAEKITPNSVKLGDKWYSLNYLGPVGMLLGAGNKFNQALESGSDNVGAIGQSIAGFGQTLLGQSFLQGMSGFIDAAKDPSRYFQNYVNSQSASVVPAAVNDMANLSDSNQRQVNNPLEAIANKIPGARQSLNIKQDVYGNDLKQNPFDAAYNAFKPSADTTATNPVINEVNRLHNVDTNDQTLQVTPTQVGKNLKVEGQNIKLTDQQRYDLQKSVGQATQTAWSSIIDSQQYQSLSDTDKAKALTNARSAVANIAQRDYLQNNSLHQFAKGPTNKAEKSLMNGGDITSFAKTSTSKSSTGGSTSFVSPSLDSSSKDLLTKYDTLSTQDKKKFLTSSNDAEFKYEQAKYNNDKASGKLSDTQDIKARAKLAKLQAGKDYSKQTRELYSLNKTQIYNYVSNNPNGAKLAKELQAYDQALYDAGLNPYLKFKTGIAPAAKTARKSSSGTRRTGGSTRRTSARTSQGVTTAKADLAAVSKVNKSSLTSLSSLSKKVASAKVAKKQLPSGNKIKGRTIMAYKKPGKTNVSMTRKA